MQLVLQWAPPVRIAILGSSGEASPSQKIIAQDLTEIRVDGTGDPEECSVLAEGRAARERRAASA